MMKKAVGLLLSFALLFALAGCGNGASSNEASSDSAVSPSQTEQSSNNEEPNSETPSNTSTFETEQDTNMENTILVAYFSATGTTEQVAQQAAEILDADLYEIVPEDPYTEEDLAYYTGGRADQEQDDPSARPAISGGVENMSQYDTILLGYPIWHGQAPRIISTFLESYDFAGKTIIPFCTSHSSGVGSSADNLHELCPDTVNWIEGSRFGSEVTGVEIESWLSSVLSDTFLSRS